MQPLETRERRTELVNRKRESDFMSSATRLIEAPAADTVKALVERGPPVGQAERQFNDMGPSVFFYLASASV